MRHRLVSLAVVSALLAFSATGLVEAREWRATPTSKAADYLQIFDRRGAGEMVYIFWYSPDILENTPQNQLSRSVLTEYVLFGVMHGDSSLRGEVTYRDIPPPVLATPADRRTPLDADSLSAWTAGLLAALKVVMSQESGELGEGFRWFLYEGEGIDSCKEGILWLEYGGERYEYRTPIPGCVR